jgi:flagellar hook assembly protein FlgD
VLTGTGLQITNIFNFPNPFSSSTVFTFEQNQVTSLDAEIKIYTVAGRMIQSLKRENVNDHFVQIPWDGRDRDGDPLANGVYLYKVIAKTQDGRLASEVLGKLSVIR